ncbi:MAG: HEAT repeat domain-containing protein [Planctomycetes bacterium]|nr:HEAT repeat domain-containing protein [Planctomycetota bacterium]
MDRFQGNGGLLQALTGRQFSKKLLAGALSGAGLLGVTWCLTRPVAEASRLPQRPTMQTTAGQAPRDPSVRYDDIKRMLEDSNPAVRLEAIKYIEVLTRPAGELIPLLSGHFNDPDPVVRIQCVYSAIRLGMPAEKGVAVAEQLLVPSNPRVCCLAAQVLGLAGAASEDALPQLRTCLTAKSIWVPLHAARAAVRIDPHESGAIGVLRRATESESGDVREFAQRALEEAVGKLAVDLDADEPETRQAAAMALEQFRSAASPAMPALMSCLTDGDLLVRAHAARAAFRAGAPATQIVPVVMDLLIPERMEVLRQATLILVEMGPEGREALPRLHECLAASATSVRLHAAEAALRIDPNDSATLKVLLTALNDRNVDVRYFAANSLAPAVLQNYEVACALRRAMGDASTQVAVAAALQYSRTQDLTHENLPQSEIVEVISFECSPEDVESWMADLESEKAEQRRMAAIRLALGGVEANPALPALIERLDDTNPAVRLAVAQAIWEIDHDAELVLSVFIELLSSKAPEIRIGAEYSLGRMGAAANRAVPELTKLLRASRSFEKLLVASSLVRIDAENSFALRLLLASVQSSETDIRYLSTVALGAMPLSHQLTAEESLNTLIQDGNSRIRHAAYESLSQLLVRRVVAIELESDR